MRKYRIFYKTFITLRTAQMSSNSEPSKEEAASHLCAANNHDRRGINILSIKEIDKK